MFRLENLTHPVIAAPMAGGPTTPELVIAAARAGGWGMLAGANKSVDALAAEVEAVRAADVAVGVNVFIPGPRSTDDEALAALREKMGPVATRFGVELGEPAWDDDDYGDKLAWLIEHPVDVVTFTFGVASTDEVDALKATGAQLGAMVTNVDDALTAQQAGMDFLIVQGPEAGGHQSTFDIHAEPAGSRTEIFRHVREATSVPLIAAGGVATPQDVREVMADGAIAAQVGTAFLCSSSSGANATHKQALASSEFTESALTRSFSGRYARSLVNDFMRHLQTAPAAYPEVHRLLAPLRKRAAAAGDPQWTNLWAGSAWQRTFAAMPKGLATSDAGAITRWLAGEQLA